LKPSAAARFTAAGASSSSGARRRRRAASFEQRERLFERGALVDDDRQAQLLREPELRGEPALLRVAVLCAAEEIEAGLAECHHARVPCLLAQDVEVAVGHVRRFARMDAEAQEEIWMEPRERLCRLDQRGGGDLDQVADARDACALDHGLTILSKAVAGVAVRVDHEIRRSPRRLRARCAGTGSAARRAPRRRAA
jgi:hypothetical protein